MRDSGRGTPRISARVAARGNVAAVVASPGPPGQFSDMATPGYPRRVAIVGGVRTPFAKAGTVLKDISAIELGKIAVRELLHRTGVEPADVNLLAFGTVIPSVIAPNIAREVALMPQLPKGVQAWSVARACASANQAITDAADQIALGHAEVAFVFGEHAVFVLGIALLPREPFPVEVSAFALNKSYQTLIDGKFGKKSQRVLRRQRQVRPLK